MMKTLCKLGIAYFLTIVCAIYVSCEKEEIGYLGCFKYMNKNGTESISNRSTCIISCHEKKFKYAIFSMTNTTCYCSHFFEDLDAHSDVLNSMENCMEYSIHLVERSLASSPRNFRVLSITESDLQISWEKPDNNRTVLSYEIFAIILETYSIYPVQNTTWIYSNNTLKTSLSLQSGSKFQLSLRVRFIEGLGPSSSLILETPIGIPDNLPPTPDILSRNGSRMEVRVHPTINNNGPISNYQIIVFDNSAKQIFQPEYLKGYQDSLSDGFNYYITAELLPEQIKNNFVIGDGKFYGKYFNAPLIASLDYTCLVSLVSSLNNVTKIAYSNFSRSDLGLNVFNFNDSIDANSVFLRNVLIISIFILIILLIGSIVLFILLRRNVRLKQRHERLSEQELTLQGPMIGIENSAYLGNEEQCPIDYYNFLKQQVLIQEDNLLFNNESFLGKGKFGTICSAILKENDSFISVAAYCIPEKNLALHDKKIMIKNLDMLIKCRKHENIVELIGTSESSNMLYVILKLFPMNLKQFLINSRRLHQNSFCEISELTMLTIIIQITKGLIELEKNCIYHTQLCASNILLDDNLNPKISGFGLADFIIDKEPDYTRWTALEVLRGQFVNPRSMTWTFGILIWEICALGATPYNNIIDKSELIEKIIKGARLPQLKYFNDDLYGIMLNCWQVDICERPNSETLFRFVEDLNNCSLIPFISFSYYQTFEYEKYEPELEFLYT